MHQAVVEWAPAFAATLKKQQRGEQAAWHSRHAGRRVGLRIGAAGTHPFSHWQHQLITDHPRYFEIVDEMQEAARSNLIFGCMCM